MSATKLVILGQQATGADAAAKFTWSCSERRWNSTYVGFIQTGKMKMINAHSR